MGGPIEPRHIRAGLTGAALIGAVALTMAADVAASGLAGPAPDSRRASGFGPADLGRLRALTGLDGAAPATVRAALASAPLAWEPFYAAGAALLPRPEAAPLLQEAARRDPHAGGPHLALLGLAADRGGMTQVMVQLSALQRLDGVFGDGLAAKLGAHVARAADATQAAAALSGHPALVAPFLDGFARTQRPAALVLALVDALPAAALDDPRARASAVAEMVRIGAYARARALWLGGLRATARPQGPVYSPDFADLTAPPPFGWALQASDAGVAERDRARGLALTAYGRVAGPLVSQLVTAMPGRWRLQLVYAPQGGAAGALRLRARCADDGAVLAERALDNGMAGPQRLDLPFVVPTGHCAAQSLEIAAQATDGARGQAVQVRRLRLSGPAPR